MVIAPARKVIASSKIVHFVGKNSKASKIFNEFLKAGDKVIINFIKGFIFLFSAIEEIDWNIYSAKVDNIEQIEDKSIWNIVDLFDLKKYKSN